MSSQNLISVSDLKKTFHNKDGDVEVLKGINFEVQKGEIFGVVGFSGAGKSTLIRCINRLEVPDSGRVVIGEHEITAMDKKELNRYRQKVGMIFQSFNLFDTKTVFSNIAYPLKVAGKSKNEIKKRVDEIIELVGLQDKVNNFPGQLSGGQKQRVGIARALANNPDVLLSDEATSALDPQTTLSILELLKDINSQLGLTILLITHQLEVVKYLCDNVAVLEDGVIVEKGTVSQIFLNPKSETAKIFTKVSHDFNNIQFLAEGEGI